jgi:hypothetical protein
MEYFQSIVRSGCAAHSESRTAAAPVMLARFGGRKSEEDNNG